MYRLAFSNAAHLLLGCSIQLYRLEFSNAAHLLPGCTIQLYRLEFTNAATLADTTVYYIRGVDEQHY
jgi:hypothetical protein